MKTKVAKEFKWSMSHRLPFHQGVCRNIHGHTYKLRVTVEGEVDSNGILIDFYDLDSAVLPLIKKLDHSFLCDEKDEVLINFLKGTDFRYHTIPMTTTAENVGFYMLIEIKKHLSSFKNLSRLIVRFYESEDAYAELEDNF